MGRIMGLGGEGGGGRTALNSGATPASLAEDGAAGDGRGEGSGCCRLQRIVRRADTNLNGASKMSRKRRQGQHEEARTN
jgi:hypothetical protein